MCHLDFPTFPLQRSTLPCATLIFQPFLLRLCFVPGAKVTGCRLPGHPATRLLGYLATRLTGNPAARLIGYPAYRLSSSSSSWVSRHGYPDPAIQTRLSRLGYLDTASQTWLSRPGYPDAAIWLCSWLSGYPHLNLRIQPRQFKL